MNNRFKFRGILTVTYGGENADDKTVDLIIEKADAIYSGDIGFDMDQLDAAIEKAGITDDIEIDQIHEFCYDNNGCRSDEYFVMDGDIEQCTGLKDKNGNLIYEGDIVRFEIVDDDSVLGKTFERICEICFGKGDYSYSFVCKNDAYYRGYALLSSILCQEIESIEIIGNVHEQTEQKDA